MYAAVVTHQIPPERGEEAGKYLHANVIPRVKQLPGFVAGYWLGTGLTVLLFESEEAARTAADQIPNAPRPDFVTISDVEVTDVIGHA